MFRRESRRWLKPAGCFLSSVECLCQHELVQKAKLKALIKSITVPATVITSSLGSPKILFSVSNIMNTELGASSRTKTCRKTREVRSSQSLGIQTRETLVICLVLPWSKKSAMERKGTPKTTLLCWEVVFHPFCQGRKQLLMAYNQQLNTGTTGQSPDGEVFM